MLLLTNTQNLKKSFWDLFSEMHSISEKFQEMSVFPQAFFNDQISLFI